jgi:hypothetical protein
VALSNHLPKTGVGRFDADVVGNKLQITHRFYLINNANKPLAMNDFVAFQDAFEDLVQTHWQDKYGFKRGAQTLEPEFVFDFLDDDTIADTAHFVIDVKDSNLPSELVSRNAPERFKNLQQSGVYFPASASLFSASVRNPSSHVLIAQDLPTMFPFYVDTNNGNLSPQSTRLLTQLAKQVAQLRPGIGVEVTAYGAAKGTAGAQVRGLLRGAGLTSVSSRQSKKFLQPSHWGKTSLSKWSGHSDYVKVTLTSDLDASLFAQSNLFTYPAAVVHEFGHMLGLQDEYACLAAAAAQKMVDLNFIDIAEKTSYESNHAAMSRVDKQEAQDGQKAFIKLCSKCGVEPPHFGRYTNNIMSAGNVYEPCHFVTLWAALCELTGHDDWQIVKLP